MKRQLTSFLLLFCSLLLLSSCGGKEVNPYAFHGLTYPPTDKVQYIFQAAQAAPECRVFAELLMSMPAGMDGAAMRAQLKQEAKAHGADIVLIGQARRMKDDEGCTFSYFGPVREHRCNDQWCGWKYSFNVWDRMGEFVSIGLGQWGNRNVSFPYPVMLQAAFLRCH